MGLSPTLLLWAIVISFTYTVDSETVEKGEELSRSHDDSYRAAVYEHAPSYRAAVYEHAPDGPSSPLVFTRDTALKVMRKNLKVYEFQAREASKQKADIIVFPEYGLTGLSASLSIPCFTPGYGENIPDPNFKGNMSENGTPWCPCDLPSKYERIEALTKLSCIAKQASIYLVANMVGLEKIGHLFFSSCPLYRQYNTNVVFDRQGCLIARYRKRHLFAIERFIYSLPPVELVTFDTDFGVKFGLCTCFDLVYKSPAVDLILKEEVHNIAFPTDWSNVFPFYYAPGYHSAWARGLRVNLLVANLHRLPNMVGSGIYSASGPQIYTYNVTSTGGQLLMANVSVLGSRRDNFSSVAVTKDHRPTNGQTFERGQGQGQTQTRGHQSSILIFRNNTFQSEDTIFEGTIFDDVYRMTYVTGDQGETIVCSSALCCLLYYSRSPSVICHRGNIADVFVLGAFQGMHQKDGKYYLETCVFVKCADATKLPTSCGQPVTESDTVFSSFTLTGLFSGSSYVYPEVVTSTPDGLNFGEVDWQFARNTTIVSNVSNPLVSATLFGRNYIEDPPLV